MCSAVISPRALGVAAFLSLGLVLSAEVTGHEQTFRGRVEKIGAGTVQSFVTLDPGGAPLAIGVTMSAGALEQLPPVPNTVSRCFDLDGNGRYTGHECMGDEERILNVPVDSTAGLPFRWIGQLESRRPSQHALRPTPLRLSLQRRRPEPNRGHRPRRLRRAGGLRRLRARHSTGPGSVPPQRLH